MAFEPCPDSLPAPSSLSYGRSDKSMFSSYSPSCQSEATILPQEGQPADLIISPHLMPSQVAEALFQLQPGGPGLFPSPSSSTIQQEFYSKYRRPRIRGLNHPPPRTEVSCQGGQIETRALQSPFISPLRVECHSWKSRSPSLVVCSDIGILQRGKTGLQNRALQVCLWKESRELHARKGWQV